MVRIGACTRDLTVACPDCSRGSARVHGRYCRTLADVAVGGRPVLIGLSVRRLFCDSPECGRRTSAEQVEGLTARHQRRRPLLQHLVEMAGVLLAGRGGARLPQILKAALSRTSVLFHLVRLSLPAAATPRGLGVDDFALYADVYATLLVDADSRLPTELSPGATPSSRPPDCGRTPVLRWSAGRLAGLPPRHHRRRPGRGAGQRPLPPVAGAVEADRGYRRRPPRLPTRRSSRTRTGTATSEPGGTVRSGRHPSPPPREAPARGGARGDRHRSLAQRRSPRAGLEPAHRTQLRPSSHLAGMCTNHPAPPASPSVWKTAAWSQLGGSEPTCFLVRRGKAPATVVKHQRSAGERQPLSLTAASGSLGVRIPGVLWRLPKL
ncbi:transposase family protein [Streptomyces sp. NPDC054783]